MNVIEITYDLRKPGRNYENVYAYLKGFEWCRPLESVWFVRTEKTAEQVRNDLLVRIDANDGLLCVNVTDDAMAWHGLSPVAGNWLRSRTNRFAA